jgi:DNA-binding CsgD family transcriptional regulator/PAS domain-containing protein
MDDEREVSDLIAQIYDAGLDPSLWVDVLAGIAHFVGGPAAMLLTESAAKKSVYDHGTDPRYRQLYFDHYIDLDPATTGAFSADIDEPLAASDIIPHHEFLATRFYREWARPQGLADFVICRLDHSATSRAMIRVFRHARDGAVDEQARRRMRLIAPHVRRSVLVGRLIDLKTAETATYADVLDGIGAGVFLVDAGARIVHANIAGQVLLEAANVLRAVDGRVVAGDSGINETLRRTLAAAAGSSDKAADITRVVVLLTTRAGEQYVAQLLPLTSGKPQRASIVPPAVAVLFVHKTALQAPSLPDAIVKSYGLTPAELRVLLAIVELGSVPEVARALGLASSTVRTHVLRLYKKTGAGREADLVKLVVGFCNPLVSGFTLSRSFAYSGD